MSVERSFTFVLGCGEQGAAWALKKPETICLDLERWKLISKKSIQGSVFYLPIASGTANLIYADFIINGLINRKVAAPQILRNPEVLATDYFPLLVKRWYDETAGSSADYVRRNILEVAKLLQTTALREMIRILAPEGKLEIVDFKKNLDWVRSCPNYVFASNPARLVVEDEDLTPDDFDRSASLTRVIREDSAVQKIGITKHLPF